MPQSNLVHIFHIYILHMSPSLLSPSGAVRRDRVDRYPLYGWCHLCRWHVDLSPVRGSANAALLLLRLSAWLRCVEEWGPLDPNGVQTMCGLCAETCASYVRTLLKASGIMTNWLINLFVFFQTSPWTVFLWVLCCLSWLFFRAQVAQSDTRWVLWAPFWRPRRCSLWGPLKVITFGGAFRLLRGAVVPPFWYPSLFFCWPWAPFCMEFVSLDCSSVPGYSLCFLLFNIRRCASV